MTKPIITQTKVYTQLQKLETEAAPNFRILILTVPEAKAVIIRW